MNSLTQQLTEEAQKRFEESDFVIFEYGSITVDEKETKRVKAFISSLIQETAKRTVEEIKNNGYKCHDGFGNDCFGLSYDYINRLTQSTLSKEQEDKE